MSLVVSQWMPWMPANGRRISLRPNQRLLASLPFHAREPRSHSTLNLFIVVSGAEERLLGGGAECVIKDPELAASNPHLRPRKLRDSEPAEPRMSAESRRASLRPRHKHKLPSESVS